MPDSPQAVPDAEAAHGSSTSADDQEQPRPDSSSTTAGTKKKHQNINGYFGAYNFAPDAQGMTDVDITSKFHKGHTVWQDGATVIPKPSWMVHTYGPLPLIRSIGIKAVDTKKHNGKPRTTEEVAQEYMTKTWTASSTHVRGARDIYDWSSNSRVTGKYVIVYLGFPSFSALASFVLTEGKLLSTLTPNYHEARGKERKTPMANSKTYVSRWSCIGV